MNRSSGTNLVKLTYFLCILTGALILFLAESLSVTYAPYLTIAGFVLLMFGLYKSTTIWVKDNPREENSKDSYIFYDEDQNPNKEQ